MIEQFYFETLYFAQIKVKWFHVLQCITNYPIKHPSFVCTQLNYQTNLFQAIELSISHGARDVMVIVVGNGHGDMSSNQDETDCISHSTNTLGKGMNPIILPPAMGKK